MKKIKLGFALLFIGLLLFSSNNFANPISSDSTKTGHSKHGMHHEEMKGKHETSNENSHQHQKVESDKPEEIVHEGIVDVKAIDTNKDGKVYQDQMHWNVISDKPGKCPLCKMILKEVTVQEAKKNLKENGYKVK